MDALTEAYVAQLLAEAPPLPADAAAVVVRMFANKTPDTSSPVSSDAA